MNEAWSTTGSSAGGKGTASGDEEDTAVGYQTNIASFKVLDERTALQLCNPNPKVHKLVQNDIDEYRKAVAARDYDFQQYLQRERYVSLDALNQRWKFNFPRWDQIQVETILQREKTNPGSSPFSLLELARYQSLTPTRLMSWWVQQVTNRDKTHLIFAGAQRSYRSLVGLPPSLNGVITECYPGVAEVDQEDHNPQAVDLARHGNRFIVIAGILARNVDPLHFGNYLYTGSLHGAAGIAISDYPALLAADSLAQVAQIALHDIRQRNLLNRVPAPCTAIVYNPYALGLTGMNRSLYGFAPGLGFYSPGLLLFYLRNGSSYGQFDYIAADDLTRVPLANYQTIVLPAVFDIPDRAQFALLDFVKAGGTVLADLGVGMLQADARLYDIPRPLQALFGVMSSTGIAETQLNMQVYRSTPFFPSLVPGLNSTGMDVGYAIKHTAQAIPLPGTDLLFQTVANSTLGLPALHPHQPLAVQATRGMFIVQQGKGLAIYATFPLYEFWMPGNMLFEEFHRDLFSRGARLSLQRPIDFLPTFCEAAAYADGSVALWTRDQTTPEAEIANPDRRVFATVGGSCIITPTGTTLSYDRPGFSLAEPLSLFVEPAKFTVKFALRQLTPQAMAFQLTPDDTAGGLPLTLHLGPDGSFNTPGAHHHVLMVTADASQEQDVQADARGWLTITLPTAGCSLTITGKESSLDVRKHPADENAAKTAHLGDREVKTTVTPNTSGTPTTPEQPLAEQPHAHIAPRPPCLRNSSATRCCRYCTAVRSGVFPL